MMKIKSSKRAFAVLIALVMVLCAFPVAASADGNTVAIDKATTTYDAAEKTITLNAVISEAGADVTVLAIKCDTAITLAELNAMLNDNTTIDNKIAYIDQVPSTTGGAVTMTFKLRELAGNYVAVAVGGEDVTVPDVYSFSTKSEAATFDVEEYYVAGEAIEFEVTDANGWMAAAKTVKVDGTVVDSGVVFENNAITVAPSVFDIGDNEEKTFALTIETADHTTVSKEIKVVAPTKVAYDKLIAAGNPSLAYMAGGVEDQENGDAIVTLPTITYAGATVTWTFSPDDATIGDGVVTLVRPAADGSAGDTASYTITATITATGYKTLTKDYTVTVKRLGLAGVEVGGNISLPVAPEVAAGASITIPGVNNGEPIAAKADGTFELGMLAPGTYSFTVKRPGYVTFTYSVEIGAEGIIAVNGEAATALAPRMIAGDVSDDGNVDGRDVGVLGGAWGATPSDTDRWNPAADLTGDGVVDGRDVGVLGGHWGFIR